MNHLVIAVSPDSSLDLLRAYADVIVLDTDQIPDSLAPYDTVYIRSHFGQESTLPENFRREIDTLVNLAKQAQPDVQFIDSMETVDAIVACEDKWNQYGRFAAFMPRTELYTHSTDINDFAHPIFKKRLSSRGAGVTWDANKADPSSQEWLIQESLTIAEELRIYVIRGEVYPTGAIKQSMDEGGRSQAINYRSLTQDEIDVSASIAQHCPELDIIGIDIARTATGELNLMEVNRSPGFAKFETLTGVNLATILYSSASI